MYWVGPKMSGIGDSRLLAEMKQNKNLVHLQEIKKRHTQLEL